jgi:hypothetical protein
MLGSQFSAIFANFLAEKIGGFFLSKTNVIMIKILHNLALF